MNALDFKETQFKPFWNHILAKLDKLEEDFKTKDLNTNQRITQELKDTGYFIKNVTPFQKNVTLFKKKCHSFSKKSLHFKNNLL